MATSKRSKEHSRSGGGYTDLLQALAERERRVMDFLNRSGYAQAVRPQMMRSLVRSYVKRPAKRLRPALLLFCAGAAGGDEAVALPAAAAVELFHTWTLVHDDIIDRDARRRGGPTLHVEAAERIAQEWQVSREQAGHFGMSAALLAGDVQHGWAIRLLASRETSASPSPEVLLALVRELEGPVLRRLVQGEVLDVELARRPLGQLRQREILNMLRLKTGTLYEFSARAGAALGLGTADLSHPLVEKLARFGLECGLAFQLQDDILGAVGDSGALGKPVGSDMREGKRTMLVYYAYQAANPQQGRALRRNLGNPHATQAQVQQIANLFLELGAVERTAALARRIVSRALPLLRELPSAEHRNLLHLWARYLIDRTT